MVFTRIDTIYGFVLTKTDLERLFTKEEMEELQECENTIDELLNSKYKINKKYINSFPCCSDLRQIGDNPTVIIGHSVGSYHRLSPSEIKKIQKSCSDCKEHTLCDEHINCFENGVSIDVEYVFNNVCETNFSLSNSVSVVIPQKTKKLTKYAKILGIHTPLSYYLNLNDCTSCS